ncbi:hypothetical protein [Sulfobacillus thermosulfidooxidans]|uniref:hypothetical protein n=1 Tax=Sulfobacillus thermosulfidooxidans TaxID=28034 RepID=UPI0006B5BF33|nr:hypothetical protein [Sulfobacillus thermosulfidooxidans]
MSQIKQAGKVIEEGGEVQIVFPHAFSLNVIQEAVEACQDGQCSCHDSEAWDKIKDIEVRDHNGEVRIHVKGENLSRDIVEACFNDCDQEVLAPEND